MQPFRIFIGYDSREPDAYDVCAASLRRHATIPLALSALKIDRLRERGLYTRPEGEKMSTEFGITRFLVPRLCEYKPGLAMFVDSDFLFRRDIKELLDIIDEQSKAAGVFRAVYCVQHDYTPLAQWKMDGQPQVAYPCKNWSSLMVFNTAHPLVVKNLSESGVNHSFQSYLHQMQWAGDQIGWLPKEWNWLEGEYDWPHDGTTPAAIHFTNGGPWFENCKSARFGDLWEYEFYLARQKP